MLYSAHTQEIIDALAPMFEEATGIKAEVVKLGSSDVIARVKAEKENPQCDVIWSIGGEQLEANSELLDSYTPKEWDKVADVFKVGTNWLPYTGIVMVFVANTEMLSDDMMPKSWSDLSDERFKDKISSARADKSGSSYMQLATVLNIYGEKGWDTYKGILSNFILSGGSSAVPRFVNDGEAEVGITLEDNAFRYVEGGGPVKIIYPSDGTTAAPDGIALVKGAPHADAAKAFIDWALSKGTQDFLVAQMGRRPVRTDGAISEALPPLSEIKTVPYDFAWSASNKKAFVEQWTELVEELGL
ncbi:MAG: extracellular solute-binding protein [bacterium]|nr:extracellular solute-binding protein [bacterium]